MEQAEQLVIGLAIVGIGLTLMTIMTALIERVPFMRRLADRIIHRMCGRRD